LRTLLEFYLHYFDFLYLDSQYRITDSKTGGDAANASLTVTGPVLTWFLTNDRGQMQLSVGPTHSLTPRNWFWPSLIKQYLDRDSTIEYLPVQKEIEWVRRHIQDIERLFSGANQHVLDIAIKNGDTITLSVPVRMIPEDSYTAAEIRYLEAHGYQRSGPNTLIPPFGGVH